jgi:hypothetical protein
VGGLTDRMGFGQIEAVEKLTAAQERLAQAVEEGHASGGLDEESRARLRSMDVQLVQDRRGAVARGAASGDRDEGVSVGEALRADIGQLTDALRALTRAAEAPVQRRAAPQQGQCARRPPRAAAISGSSAAWPFSAVPETGSRERSGPASWTRSPRF